MDWPEITNLLENFEPWVPFNVRQIISSVTDLEKKFPSQSDAKTAILATGRSENFKNSLHAF